MKRCRMEFAFGALLAAGALAMPAAAQQPRVVLNDQPVIFQDQQPIQREGRVYVPLRGVLEQMGAERLEWRPEEREVVVARGDQQILMQIGRPQAMVNNQQIALDAPPLLMNGRTLVPLRFVSEQLGADVRWEAPTRTVYIYAPEGRVAGAQETFPPNGQTPPPPQPDQQPPLPPPDPQPQPQQPGQQPTPGEAPQPQ